MVRIKPSKILPERVSSSHEESCREGEDFMAGKRLEQALKSYRQRYWKSTRKEKSLILDEFCELTHYHRKYATALLNDVNDEPSPDKRKSRRRLYSEQSIRILAAIWKAAGYPWSVRLKAMLPQWLPEKTGVSSSLLTVLMMNVSFSPWETRG